MSEDPISFILKRIVKFFEQEKIKYVIVGGVAVIILGRTRMTLDVDIIVDHRHLDRKKFVDYMNTEGFKVSLSDLDAFDEKMHCSLFLRDAMFRIDIKGIYTQREQITLEEAISSSFNGIDLSVDSPENLIVNKLIFGSEQDYEDAIAVFIRQEERISQENLLAKGRQFGIEDEMKDFLSSISTYKKEVLED